ncbi:hypothetical protein H257_09195 [Aphanomyces astaci]|uniref:WRKY19-like zinc finger domain-containing protein n=1 Tax=Aphanomyces astaci TaxID=112090 RepID=W4GAN3_APHAT|nr:hypothetical protein H257_09195 [Aphanomyces astaci]ETV76725.1 hypothetical protein H257_09195 [Aphanomyces astaci]|eukprot:XP_009833637.1 hypothetical protein H257_09195 [Aphanomyces astaci]
MLAAECCFFNSCQNPSEAGSWKCIFHRSRDKCSAHHCRNQACGRGYCVSHGGKRPCLSFGCDANARIGGFCSRHGQTKKKRSCEVEGCTKFAHARQRCVAHGGGRRCDAKGCLSQSRNGGYCQRHGRQRAILSSQERKHLQIKSEPSIAAEQQSGVRFWGDALCSSPSTMLMGDCYPYDDDHTLLDLDEVKLLELLLEATAGN